MGATQSTDPDDEVVDKEYGFRVHHVEENGPGRAAGLESIFDYIVVANGVRTDQDDGTFVRMIKEAEGTNMQLTVFNTHTLTTRETILLPNADWGGAGLLGITIRFDLAQDVAKHTLHVLEVYDESPASNAGLVSYNDYVVGVGDLLFDGPDDFGEIIALNEKRAVRLFVYASRSRVT
jgi:C-terminal processing protease CtpA/Prc